MVDLAKIKRNVAKMASMNAPEEDIDGYIASEGVTIDDIRNYKEPSQQIQPLSDEKKEQIRQEVEGKRGLSDVASSISGSSPAIS